MLYFVREGHLLSHWFLSFFLFSFCLLSRCLEAIIAEQMEKLTATLRGIRSLTSHARSKASKLTQLIDQFESTQVGIMSRLETLTMCNKTCDKEFVSTFQSDDTTKSSDVAIVGSSLSEEERKRLANELEELERER